MITLEAWFKIGFIASILSCFYSIGCFKELLRIPDYKEKNNHRNSLIVQGLIYASISFLSGPIGFIFWTIGFIENFSVRKIR